MSKKRRITEEPVVEQTGAAVSSFKSINFKLKCKNKMQKQYYETIKNNNITICTGPSGTGKSYVAIATALELLKDPDTPYEKLVFMVAPIQTDMEVGFLKGDLKTKLEPFVYSYFHNMADMIGGGMWKVDKMVESGLIEVMCVSFARGINLKNCICIIGECQQYSKESFLTIATRPSETSKLIFEGDIHQCDNKRIRRGSDNSGLGHALDSLSEIEGIGVVEFDKTQIVRNPLITEILTKWDPDTYGNMEDYVHCSQEEFVDGLPDSLKLAN